MNLETNAESPKRTTRHLEIIAISLIAALFIVFGIWFANSRPADSEGSDLVQLDNQRVILDNSMNLYDPLVNRFSTRYTDAFAEGAPDEDKQEVLDQETTRLKRESGINRDRLQRMESSPALKEQEVADAFSEFKREYGAVIAYNDQLAINLANIARSVGGPCASLHSKLNAGGGQYAQEYIKSADECLTALSSAQEGSDGETAALLSGVEDLIRKQRDSQQKVVDGKDAVEIFAARTQALLAMLDINKTLTEAQTKYESDVKAKYTEIINKANTSNAEFERILKDSLESSGSGTKSEG